MRHLEREKMFGPGWCASCGQTLGHGDESFKDRERNVRYCQACAPDADLSIRRMVYRERRRMVVNNLERMVAEGARVAVSSIISVLPVEPDWE
jgi:hypothetical protein